MTTKLEASGLLNNFDQKESGMRRILNKTLQFTLNASSKFCNDELLNLQIGGVTSMYIRYNHKYLFLEKKIKNSPKKK